MQTDSKELYKLTAQQHGLPEQFYKDLGNFVFSSLYKSLRRPESLIIKLKGVGYWYLRRARMKLIAEKYNPLMGPEPITEAEKNIFASRLETHEIFIERLKEYEQYILERNEIRNLRYGNETLPESADGEIKGPEASKD